MCNNISKLLEVVYTASSNLQLESTAEVTQRRRIESFYPIQNENCKHELHHDFSKLLQTLAP